MGKWTDRARSSLSKSRAVCAKSAKSPKKPEDSSQEQPFGTIGTIGADTGNRIAGLPTEAYDDSDRLAGILDEDRGIELEDLRKHAEALGIEGRRFARALAALPERYDDDLPRNPDGTPREPGSDDDRED